MGDLHTIQAGLFRVARERGSRLRDASNSFVEMLKYEIVLIDAQEKITDTRKNVSALNRESITE